MRFQDKVVIVTGGAGGIGLATAKRFLEEGARVALWDYNSDGLARASAYLQQDFEELRAYEVNVTDEYQVDSTFRQVEEDLGAVDIMICNAGITRDAMLHKMSVEAFDAVIDVNLKGVFLCGQTAAKCMRERGSGVILSTSSIVGIGGNIGQSNYAATKAGVIAMTQTWARELGSKGIRVNAVAPGFIETEIIQTVPEKVKVMVENHTSLGRIGKPIEIANTFIFLASEEASFITGQVVSVDGGLRL